MTATTENPPLGVCGKCRLSTTVPQLLKRKHRSFRLGSSRKLLVCPRCAGNERRNLVVANLIMGFLAVALLIFVPPATKMDEPPFLRTYLEILAAAVLFEPVVIFLHEAAHAAVGWAVGLRVFGIAIGFGPRLCRFRIRNFLLEINLLPFGGLCWVAPGPDPPGRWPLIFMCSAGMMLHLLILGLLLCFAPGGFPPSVKWLYSGWWLGLVFINLGCLLMSLIPATRYVAGARRANDGKVILHLLRSKNSLTQWMAARYALEINACLEMGRVDAARRWLEKGRSVDPNSLSFRAAELLVMGAEKNWDDVCTKAREWLSATTRPTERMLFAIWLAVAIVYARQDLAEADALCAEIMSVEPWDSYVQTVAAFISIAKARHHEAEDFLKKAHTERLFWSARAAGAHCWAELFRLKGDAKRQRKWQSRASTLDPNGAFRIPVPQKPQ